MKGYVAHAGDFLVRIVGGSFVVIVTDTCRCTEPSSVLYYCGDVPSSAPGEGPVMYIYMVLSGTCPADSVLIAIEFDLPLSCMARIQPIWVVRPLARRVSWLRTYFSFPQCISLYLCCTYRDLESRTVCPLVCVCCRRCDACAVCLLSGRKLHRVASVDDPARTSVRLSSAVCRPCSRRSFLVLVMAPIGTKTQTAQDGGLRCGHHIRVAVRRLPETHHNPLEAARLDSRDHGRVECKINSPTAAAGEKHEYVGKDTTTSRADGPRAPPSPLWADRAVFGYSGLLRRNIVRASTWSTTGRTATRRCGWPRRSTSVASSLAPIWAPTSTTSRARRTEALRPSPRSSMPSSRSRRRKPPRASSARRRACCSRARRSGARTARLKLAMRGRRRPSSVRSFAGSRCLESSVLVSARARIPLRTSMCDMAPRRFY